MSLDIGDTIDEKYRIVRLLGEGGMGAVYEGENLRIHRKVAIKILHSNVAESADAVQRFEREAQAAGRIGSEHIVEVLDLGELPSGDRYMVMEYLDGEALNDRIKNAGKISPQATASIIVDMLEGLKAAHNAGIFHRDLKPDNVFLLANKGGKTDFVKIVDFGISKFSTLGGEFSMTQTGAVMGTPYYLSPEQAKGERNVDHRSDIYAVGVILWESVAGHVPFDGETFNELLFKIVLEPIPTLSSAVEGIDEHFAAIVEKAMARDPDQRFQSAEEIQQALRGWLSGQPPAPELSAAIDNPGAYQTPATGVPGVDGNAGTIINKTNANWANTQGETQHASSSKKWGLIAAAAVVLAGGGGLLAMNTSSEAEEVAAARAAEEEKREEAEKKREEEFARLEAAKAKAEAEKAKADHARSEAEKAKTQAEISAAERERQFKKEKEEAEAKKEAARRAVRVRRPSPKPNPSPAPAPTGRRIRTDL